MTQEIESVKPTISVIIDDGDFIISSTGPIGKAMAQAILPLAAGAHRVTIISDGEMKVMKRNGNGGTNGATKKGAVSASTAAVLPDPQRRPASPASPTSIDGPDIQDQFVNDLEAGVTGEIATGEAPPKPPTPKRKPQIFQDAAAPPAPELAEAEMDRLLQEAEQGERDAAKLAEDRRFQSQQAVQAEQEPTDVDPAAAKASPRKRERNLAINGSPCGNCGGSGQSVRVDSTGSFIPDEHGRPLGGVCQVCGGSGQIKTWGRGRR